KKMPHIDVRHSTLEEYARYLAQSVEVDSLKKVYGERRSAQNNNRCGNLFGYTTSARMYLKQANFDTERWIQYYAEPFNIFSGMMGRDINDQYTQTAWELIVQNSAHDSIGGCSLDRIHEDMMLRYKHAVEISKGVFERSLKSLLLKLNTSDFAPNDDSDIYLTAVNATNYQRGDVVEAFVDIPVSLDKGDFDVYDQNGHRLEKSIISRHNHQPVLEQMINRPMFFNMVQYKVWLQMKDVTEFGLKTFRVMPVEAIEPVVKPDADNLSMQNAFLKVRVRADGSLDITDKQNNISYEGVAWFEDQGDAGHAWVLKPIAPTISTRGTQPEIVKSFSGEVYNEITITHKLLLPANLRARKENSGEQLENIIVLKVGLGKSHKHLSLDVKVHNASESHRLRMMVPTGLDATHSFGEGQFDVVKRSLERPDTSDWIEQPMYDFPMHHFVDINDGEKGIAALVDGLKEYEVLPDKDRTLAITLFRTFEYKINPSAPQDYSHEKGAQMLGESDYRLALYPHAGDWQQGKVYREAFLFNYPLRLVQTGKLQGEMGTHMGMMSITPEELIFGAMKLPENEEPNAFVLRLYNPTDDTLEGGVQFLKEITSVEKLTLEEIAEESVAVVNSNSFGLRVKSKEIVSFRIRYE
ncbi:MAG: glycoside hydrolase family 38 C-terminal domain-containing protein, partial [Bacteroidota bacterium]